MIYLIYLIYLGLPPHNSLSPFSNALQQERTWYISVSFQVIWPETGVRFDGGLSA